MHEILYSFAIESLHQDETFPIYFYACLLNNQQLSECQNIARYFEMDNQ